MEAATTHHWNVYNPEAAWLRSVGCSVMQQVCDPACIPTDPPAGMQTLGSRSVCSTQRIPTNEWCRIHPAPHRRSQPPSHHVNLQQLSRTGRYHTHARHVPRAVQEGVVKSDAERFIDSLKQDLPESSDRTFLVARDVEQLQARVHDLRQQIQGLQQQLDGLFQDAFAGTIVTVEREEGQQEEVTLPSMTDAEFAALGRSDPPLLAALLAAKSADGAAWRAFQSAVQTLKLQRQRSEGALAESQQLLDAAQRAAAKREGLGMAGSEEEEEEGGEAAAPVARVPRDGAAARPVRIVLVCGFESFNVSLYKAAAVRLARLAPNVSLVVFSDRDIATNKAAVAAALKGADAFFGSLLFDYDAVEWLRAAVADIPVVLVFESALELMGTTRLGSFTMDPSGKSKGPPPAVKKVLSLFGSGREEDRMVGYLSFLKVGPALLRFIPGKKAQDLRGWLTVYSYWNQGGLQNVVSMFSYLVERFLAPGVGLPPPPPPQETPATGCLHPDAPGRYFTTPAQYMAWYAQEGPLRGQGAPVVGVLLYRKHVITQQEYIPQLIRLMESQGVLPVPIFINGVEAHTVVRDQLTSAAQQAAIASGAQQRGSLAPDALVVDAVVNTIGFPLVGGPAGTMEGGRQAEVSRAILSALDVPYLVAAPLLIQDLASWNAAGVAGLQSVVLYALPELDGAIDTVALGGLVGDDIFLVPERVIKLAARLRKWVELRRKPASERKVAVLLYGFPPGVGSTGTAALLNVPRSLEAALGSLAAAGYDLGPGITPDTDLSGLGEALVSALKAQEESRTVARGAAGVAATRAGAAAAWGATPTAAEVKPAQLRDWLSYPDSWGPSEWGPIPFLPDPDVLVQRMEAQWGPLYRYRGIATTAAGNLLVSGVSLGNVLVGVQPLLGLEGDPMRLLFERDLTPHPQYAAFYKWLQRDYGADVVLHFGMHGTVEWLPGSPLGNTGLSWSDVLLGELPNVYVYAANNPSESIVAKRRGYGTIISHNVPPYGRAGLYKQLATLRELLAEYRESPSSSVPLVAPILAQVVAAGLQDDVPWLGPSGEAQPIDPEQADSLDPQEFMGYAGRLWSYLGELENRLFSEGLHVLGAPPSPSQLAAYLGAYYGEALPPAVLEAVEAQGVAGLEAARTQLERAWAQPAAGPGAAGAPPRVDPAVWEEAASIADLLARNREELTNLLAGLGGRYVPPEAGGDLLRDGPAVLPTGRNIHALDPYRMPGPAAAERGAAAAAAILEAHRESNGGAWPETLAVNLWGLDAIKTKGESVAMVLHLVGAVPVKEGTGRIARYELLPLSELGGRPRVDVLCNMSGIFRDAFQNVVELLDDLFARAAAADEPDELNFIRKHARAMQAQGITAGASSRLFSNPAGDYGSMVNERVGASNWNSSEELGDTWAARNSYSYGRGGEKGVARPEVLQALLGSCERVVQEVDSVEYGLTDIQEYYANTGALVAAAKNARQGAPVACSIVEAFGKEVKPRDLEDVLRLEYRSKLLNPKWASAMAAQGSGGAYEISTRMTALLGWGATTGYADAFAWDQAADTYVLDPEMSAQLRKSNPQAFSNMLKRCLEAAGRGLWRPDPKALAALQEQYEDLDAQLEGVTIAK